MVLTRELLEAIPGQLIVLMPTVIIYTTYVCTYIYIYINVAEAMIIVTCGDIQVEAMIIVTGGDIQHNCKNCNPTILTTSCTSDTQPPQSSCHFGPELLPKVGEVM